MKDDDSAPTDPNEFLGIDPTGGLDDILIFGSPATRRHFLKQVAGTSAAITFGPALAGLGTAQAAEVAGSPGSAKVSTVPVRLKINGKEQTLTLDPRTTLLDALREHL